MKSPARRSVEVVAVAAAAALVIWGAARLLGVDLTVGKGQDPRQVGPLDVVLATVVAGLAAWGAHRLLARSPRTVRWWPFVGSTALAVSMAGPSYLADGAAAVALMGMHLAVGAILIKGFAVQTPFPAPDCLPQR